MMCHQQEHRNTQKVTAEMTHSVLNSITHGQTERFCWLTVAYTAVELALAFLVGTGLGRVLSDGLLAGDAWTVAGMLAAALWCASRETRHSHKTGE
jgi:hypothetical protein